VKTCRTQSVKSFLLIPIIPLFAGSDTREEASELYKDLLPSRCYLGISTSVSPAVDDDAATSSPCRTVYKRATSHRLPAMSPQCTAMRRRGEHDQDMRGPTTETLQGKPGHNNNAPQKVCRTCLSCVCVLVTFPRKNVRSVRSPVSYSGTYS
jgi:hypothetical protein